MGLSNQIPSSRLIQPGVIANSSERPASPYEGQVVFQKDTNQTLVWDGSAWVYLSTSTANPPGLELVTSCTVTSVGGTAATASNGVITIGNGNTSVTVNDAFSDNYDNYLILGNGGGGSVASLMGMQLGSTTSNYWSSLIYTAWSSTPQAVGTKTATSWTYAGSIRTNSIYLEAYIQGPKLTKPTAMRSVWWQTGDSGFHSGFLDNDTAYTSFTLIPSAGSFTGGTIRVYGYRD